MERHPYNSPPSPLPGYHSSGVSELDSLSDSDWLDVASNRESDDNDSLCSRDSDHEEVDYRRRSRRSSTSNISSRDGEVEAWEGFVEDSADESALVDHASGASIPVSAPTADDSVATVADASPILEADIAEDQRVKQALDQSMISTLSSSRSSAQGGPPHSSVHNSSRDLRLSFPDPLTSSRDQINGSYQNVSPEHTSVIDDDDSDSEEEDVEPDATAETRLAMDPSSDSTLETPSPSHINCICDAFLDVDIVLYSAPSALVEKIVARLIQKAIAGRATAFDIRKDSTNWLHVEGKTEHPTSSPGAVAIINSVSNSQQDPSLDIPLGRPSLAIICLPLSSAVSERHSFYLPLIVSPLDHSAQDAAYMREEAQRSLDSLSVPPEKILHLKEGNQSPILDIDDLDELNPEHVYDIIRQLTPTKKRALRSLRSQLTSAHLVTLVALLSVVLGFVVNTSFRSSSSTPTRTAPPSPVVPIWHRIRPTNYSGPIPATPGESNAAMVPSSLKDFAVAVFNPLHSGTAVPPSSAPRTACKHRVSAEQTPHEMGSFEGYRLMSWSERIRSTKDIILRPVSAMEHEGKALSLISRKSSQASEQSTSSLSLKLPNSLAEIFDMRDVLVEVVRRDIKDLVDALDELMRVINYQTAVIVKQSQGAVDNLRDGLQKRHVRAQERAQQLKMMGAQLVSSAGEQIRERAGIAKNKARSMRENFIGSDVWGEYRQRVKKAVEVSHLGLGQTRRDRLHGRRQRRGRGGQRMPRRNGGI